MKRLLLINLVLFALIVGCASDKSPQEDGFQRIEVLGLDTVRNDVLPLFILGDVDEDGAVGHTDLQLLESLIQDDKVDAVTCLAGADLTMDSEVDARDVELLRRMIGSGELTALPLYAQPALPCTYSKSFLAASPEIIEGEPVRLRLFGGIALDNVEIEVEAGAEIVSADDGPGWDIYISDSERETITIGISLADAAFLYTVAGDTDETDEGLAFDAGDDPRDTPPPTSYGEEIDDLDICPQEDCGCEALVVDLIKRNDRTVEAAERTREALEKVECNVIHIAPRFRRIPAPWVFSVLGVKVTIPPKKSDIEQAKEFNRASWIAVRKAIMDHRTRLAEGRNLGYQLVNAHGKMTPASHGSWGPGFSTGAGTLKRSTFHFGNYRWGRGKLCNAVMEDRSCYSGYSAYATDVLDNTGSKPVSTAPAEINHDYHAAFYGDMAFTTSVWYEVTYNSELIIRDKHISSMIERLGRNGKWLRLANGFRQEAVDIWSPYSGYHRDGQYSDRGYNKRPGTYCEEASHVRR